MSVCTNCGSKILLGGPQCCDGGEAKRARATRAEAALVARIEDLERRFAALEQRLSTLLEVTP